jgi:DNA-binding NarL/FixJ family response regulator
MQSQVIICDQQAIYAMGSALMVEKHASYLPATIINSLTHISDLLVANVPGVLVIDSSMVDFSDHSKKEHITAIKKRTPIMIVLNEDDNLLLFQFIENGFSVIISRNATKAQWLKGLEMTRLEKVFFCDDVSLKVNALMNNYDDLQLFDKVNDLKLYDKYILIRICQEAPSKQIAFELGNSKRTIEGHRTKMMHLFEVKNVAGLVKVACISKLYDNYLSNPGLYDVTLCAKTSSL